MSYRGGPKSIAERVAEIEARLRQTTRVVVGTVVVTVHGLLDGLGADDHPQYQLRSERGQADGYPELDGSTVPKAQLPADVVYAADLPDLAGLETLVWLTMAEGP